jgi:hypothetical protein
MSTPGEFSPPPQKSGGSSVLVIILVVLGVLFLGCAGLCGGCYYLGKNAAQQIGTELGAAVELMPSMMQAQGLVLNDPQVVQKLGEPVSPAGAGNPIRQGSGEVKPGGETFTFSVQGPNGSADVTASAMKDLGSWKLTVITVTCSDGTTINVPIPEGDSGPEMQFDLPDETP